MTPLRRLVCLGAVLPMLAVAACSGEGWEMVPYHGVPYTDDRTAGTGVAYVRANMMPAKGPVIEEKASELAASPAEETPAPAAAEEAPKAVEEAPAEESQPEISSGDKVFDKTMSK